MCLSVSNMKGRAGVNEDSGNERQLAYSTWKDTLRTHRSKSDMHSGL